MDSIGSTNKHYKNISGISTTVLIIVIQAYLMLILGGLDIFNFSQIGNEALRYVLQILIQLVAFSFIYSMIYTVVRAIYCHKWIRENRNCFIRGMWLHIHVKSEIRIGTVEIKQNFNTIQANGHNICPKIGDNLPEHRETTWHYIMGMVKDEDENARDFIGCYTAGDVTNQVSKDGIHTLRITETDKAGYARTMVGGFRDTFKIDSNGVYDVGNHAGNLYFFKLSDKCKKYLYDENGFNYSRLCDMHELEEFSNEPYVIELRRIIASQDKA